MLCLNSFGKFLKKMVTSNQNKLYNLIFIPTTHTLWGMIWGDVFSMPARGMWISLVIIIGNYLIDSGLLWFAMMMLQAQKQGISYVHVWKKSSVLVFVFGLIADFVGFLITDLFYYSKFRVLTFEHGDSGIYKILAPVCVLFNKINDKFVPADWNWFNTVGAGLLGASITCILIYVLNRYISFRRCEMDDKFKLKLAIFMAILTTPWYFALPPIQ